ncbi:MAG: transcription-repair coupling factor [Thermoleophilia bacterium]|nr:transcription-repair coupling factor [Thermoleophilia bacterium]
MSDVPALEGALLEVPEVAEAVQALSQDTAAQAIAIGRPAWPLAIATLLRALERPLLVVVPRDEEARGLASEVDALLGAGTTALLPTVAAAARSEVGAAPHLVGQRARAVSWIGQERARLVIAGVGALAESTAAAREPLVLRAGSELTPDGLVDDLVRLGYERVEQVEERGEVAVRGGIVDVYPSTADLPARADFFGDQVESLRAFSPFTQRTVREVKRSVVWPAAEPEDAPLGPLDLNGGARVIRLAPTEYAGGLREVAERLDDDERAGRVDDELLSAKVSEAARLDVEPPRGERSGVVDVVEARFAVRGMDEAAGELRRLARNGYRVVVAFARWGDLRRAQAQLKDRLDPVELGVGELPSPGAIGFARMPLERGFLSKALRLALIPEYAILRRRRQRSERPAVGTRVRSVLDLKLGDIVVHDEQGIGRLVGFETREVAGIARDYLSLVYAEGDRLLVPHDQLDKVSRYVGADGSDPALSKLGGKAWQKMKARARAAAREMAGELIQLYDARARATGFAFPPQDELVREFERGFPHMETPDQQRTIDAVYDDMERDRPMDRLVCGDVGFGKTEVAMRAAFKAAAGGKQAMVLAPTTILSQQHFNSFRERFDGMPVSVELVNRFKSQKEVRDSLQRFRQGQLDILIGTHRLLSMDVQPKDLGLVVVDEEQRFGVAQKEALRQLRVSVDVLAMTATPIPRTLQMSLSGLREISVIETPPLGRKPVATHVGPFDDDIVTAALQREAERNGQAFWLHNRVETINEAAERVRALVPEQRVVVAHGQMPEGELEDVMLGFVRGEAAVLVATTIIESGLDIPRSNTLIVERADELGLAQLYQLRGRVGRSEVTAHAYLMYPDDSTLSRDSAARLRALADYTELGSGLRIAMRDLEIRGAGNLLGDEQSGQVAAVGFEMYMDLLHDAITLGAGEAPAEAEVRVDLPISAYIPSDYVGFEAAKIEIHRRIAAAGSLEQLDGLASEIEDRFGERPRAVENLLATQRLRVLMRQAGANHLALSGSHIALAPLALTGSQLTEIRRTQRRLLYASRERTVTLPTGRLPSERLRTARELLDAVAPVVSQNTA